MTFILLRQDNRLNLFYWQISNPFYEICIPMKVDLTNSSNLTASEIIGRDI